MSTHLPADLFTPTEGSTYLLDGYPDTAYGEGTAHKWDSATVRGLSGLPDGVIGGDSSWETDKQGAINWEGFTLPEELDKEESTPDVVDHSWVDPDQGQDPDRLPKTPHVAIPQLVEAWGQNRRTDGVHLVPVVDKDRADYEASLRAPARKATASKAHVADAIARAWRRVTAGEPIRAVGVELANSLGDAAPSARVAFDAMRAEVGLIGKVYVRADAYPKCADGVWSATVRKTACDAQYVLSKPACGGCAMAQQGRCAAFGGRRLVADVPYQDALGVYGPRLTAIGVRVASGDPKSALRWALREAANRKSAAPDTNFPIAPDVAAGVSATDARRALASVQGPAPVRHPDDARLERDLVDARRRVARYVRDGMIGRDDAAHLVVSVTDPAEMLRRAAAVAARPVGASDYSGAENDLVRQAADRGLSAIKTPSLGRTPDEIQRDRALTAARHQVMRYVRDGIVDRDKVAGIIRTVTDPVELMRRVACVATRPLPAAGYSGVESTTVTAPATAAEARRALTDAEIRARQAQQVVNDTAEARERAATRAARRSADIARKVASVVAEIDRGVRGAVLAGFIHRTIAPDEVREASVALDPVLRRTGALKEGPAESRKYAGAQYAAAPQYARVAASPPPADVSRMARWTRRLMAEGVAGSELNHRIAARFAPGVRTAGTDVVAAIRREHEGLSGHVYVDAAAYATKAGTGGCEEGARHHRANAIPAVLEMPERCDGCVHRTARADGTATCSLYAKPLVASAAEVVTDPARHQRDMIRLADAPDQEVTASLFANTFDPTEFALGLDTELDHVDVEDMPEPEAVGQYLFGGITID
jgi:hypothetical protein